MLRVKVISFITYSYIYIFFKFKQEPNVIGCESPLQDIKKKGRPKGSKNKPKTDLNDDGVKNSSEDHNVSKVRLHKYLNVLDSLNKIELLMCTLVIWSPTNCRRFSYRADLVIRVGVNVANMGYSTEHDQNTA